MTPKHLVETFYHDVWNKQDAKLARKILAGDFKFRGSLGLEHEGPDAFIDYMNMVHTALGQYHCIIEDLIISENRVAAQMTFRGFHQNDFLGVPATGKLIQWQGAAFFTIKGEAISALWVLGDMDSLKAQLA